MDEKTTHRIDNFISYLLIEFKQKPALASLQYVQWHITDNNVSIKFILNGEKKTVHVDLREINENQGNFHHLLNNISDQLEVKSL